MSETVTWKLEEVGRPRRKDSDEEDLDASDVAMRMMSRTTILVLSRRAFLHNYSFSLIDAGYIVYVSMAFALL